MPRVTSFLVAIWLAPPIAAAAQAVWQADIRIQAMEVSVVAPNTVAIRVVIASDNDDDAKASRLDLLLPIGVSVLRVTPPCRSGSSALRGPAGRVTCDLGDIPVRGVRDLTVVTSAPPPGGGGRYAAFVMSDTPDPFPSNNYAERTVR